MLGAGGGALVGTALVSAASFATGFTAGDAAGIGAFVGMWGGGGFGFMVAGSVALARRFEAVPARSS